MTPTEGEHRIPDEEPEVVVLRRQVGALVDLLQIYKGLLDKIAAAHREKNTVVEMALLQAYELVVAKLDGKDTRALEKAHEAESYETISNVIRQRMIAALEEEKIPDA